MTDYKKAFIDTAPFIYFIEKDSNHPQYYEKVKGFFKDGYDNDKRLLNKTYSLIDMFHRLVTVTSMDIVEINQDIAKQAAQIRAEYTGFKAMDALQLAAASFSKCDLFLTNDKQLKQFKGMKCITVDELNDK